MHIHTDVYVCLTCGICMFEYRPMVARLQDAPQISHVLAFSPLYSPSHLTPGLICVTTRLQQKQWSANSEHG